MFSEYKYLTVFCFQTKDENADIFGFPKFAIIKFEMWIEIIVSLNN